MARTGTGAKRLGEPTLTAADWAEAALQLMAERGLSALTVDALAARLGVTKGSFYWHFTGRSDLIAAALARWEERATMQAIAVLDAMPEPRRRLELLLDASSQAPRSRSLYAALAEAAGDAAGDAIVRQALNRVATARIDYLDTCYSNLGLTPPRARAYAVFAYAAYRGLLQLAHEAPTAMPADWSIYPEMIREALVSGAIASKATPSKAAPPKAAAPKATAPKAVAPKGTAPRAAAPKATASKDTPRTARTARDARSAPARGARSHASGSRAKDRSK
jgi:AcrR family transcriptional regulator